MKIYLLVLMPFILGCSPKIVVNTKKVIEEIKPYDTFITLELKDAFDLNQEQYLGEIKVKDSGGTIDCSYEIFLALAKDRARKLGGNLLKITDYRLPNLFTTCPSIVGKVYRLSSVSKYEKTIVWNENRKLKQVDFKGSPENRPFEAATASYYKSEYSKKWGQKKGKFSIITFFDCEKSYFKGTQNVDTVLAHEQGHFDITELYARKLIKILSEEVKNLNELNANLERIADENNKALQIEHDKYDSEIYPDPTKQSIWLAKLKEELKKYEAYKDKTIFISHF